jgi:hypothetical protein
MNSRLRVSSILTTAASQSHLNTDLSHNAHFMEHCRTSFSIIYFQQITGTAPIGLLEQPCAGMELDPWGVGVMGIADHCAPRVDLRCSGRIVDYPDIIPHFRVLSVLAVFQPELLGKRGIPACSSSLASASVL